MKYLLLFAFLAVVWMLMKKRRDSPVESRPEVPVPGEMVVCAHCGVHFPDDDGVTEGDRHYCCEAHRQAERG